MVFKIYLLKIMLIMDVLSPLQEQHANLILKILCNINNNACSALQIFQTLFHIDYELVEKGERK